MSSWTTPPPDRRDSGPANSGPENSGAGTTGAATTGPATTGPAAGARRPVAPRHDPPRHDATASPVAPGAHDHHLHLPAGAHVADRRGLTAAGAVTLALALGLIGAFIDVNTGVGLGTAFAVLFVTGSGLGALLAHREDLLATVVAPPLTYCVLALIGAAIGHTAAAGSFVTQQALELVSALILGAPTLYAATGLALIIALVRRTRRRAA